MYAYNQETFGPEGTLGRASDREVILTRYLLRKLHELNPGLPDDAYTEAVRQIVEFSSAQTLLATNRDKYSLFKGGVQVAFRNAKGERVKDRLRIFDFSNPENNHFLAVRELWVQGDLYRRRADIIGFVNGIPLLFIECKNIHKNLRTAYDQNLADYKDTVPHLFHHNAIVMLGNGNKARIGSVSSKWGHFHEWKRLAEQEPGVVDKAYIFSLVQKFNKDIEPDEGYTQRDDIIVITDEAHRTQYGRLALNMRNALPYAGYIGFTGTPLFKDDEVTRRVFGDYVSTYDFQRAVEDEATVPLYYDARGDKLGLAIGDLNERIAAKLEELETEDIDVGQRLEKELKRDYHIITANKRLEQVARDFVKHYSTAWETGKAMLVCIDKITCVRMHDLFVKLWAERIRMLEDELSSITDEQEEIYRQRQLAWMKETLAAVVVSEEQGEVDKFHRWDLDITPHRKLIKQGFELEDGTRVDLEEAFKKEAHPFRVAIMCAMWLTGFDVPGLSTLYLDKPLKAHTLMQAIARANRVNEGKNNGLIVDYCGILKTLRKALATFAGTADGGHGGEDGDGERDPAKPEDELLCELQEAIAFVQSLLEKRNASLDKIIEKTGLPVDSYTEEEVGVKAEDVFRHVYRAYPTVPSPFYAAAI